MLRSEINALIRDAEAWFEAERFRLPPFAFWTAEEWANPDGDISEIVDCGLGWDITDFGLGEYHTCGLLLFTMRNGRLANLKAGVGKIYCEKAVILDPGQHCPAHHHWIKVEDIIVRAGGTMGAGGAQRRGGRLLRGHRRHPEPRRRAAQGAGGDDPRARGPGRASPSSLAATTSSPRHGGGCSSGEVSVVNDDVNDNRFHQPVGRFPEIEEDEPPYRLLIGDYASLASRRVTAPADPSRFPPRPARTARIERPARPRFQETRPCPAPLGRARRRIASMRYGISRTSMLNYQICMN